MHDVSQHQVRNTRRIGESRGENSRKTQKLFRLFRDKFPVQNFPLQFGGAKVEENTEGIVRRLEIRTKLGYVDGNQSMVSLQLDDGGPFHHEIKTVLPYHLRTRPDPDLPL